MKNLLTFALLLSSLGCSVVQRVTPILAPIPEIVAIRPTVTQFQARTDLDVVQLPAITPDLGDCIGANKKIVDPNFHTTMVRATDCKTDSTRPNISYFPPGGGSAMANPFSANEQWIAVEDQGGKLHVLQFNPNTLQVGTQQWTGKGSLFFDRTLGNVAYNLSGGLLTKLLIGKKAVQTHALFDYNKVLPKGYKVQWQSDGGCNTATTICAAAFSEGVQDSGFYIVVWQKGGKSRVYNTQTGKVTGNWGDVGTVDIPDRYLLHQVKLSFLGDTLIITHAQASCPECNPRPYIWDVKTLDIKYCTNLCDGHWAPGYLTLVNNSGKGSNGNGQFQQRLFNAPSMATPVIKDLPSALVSPFTSHISWNNDNPTDTAPFAVTNTDTGKNNPFFFAWDNEILLVDPTTGLVHREGHTEITGKSPFFIGANAIGPNSNNNLIMFATDWQGKFANGNQPRCDVVIARMW